MSLDDFQSWLRGQGCALPVQARWEGCGLRLALSVRDPRRLLGWLALGLRGGHTVFLCNPDWSPSQWAQARAAMQAHWFVDESGVTACPLDADGVRLDVPPGPWICIPTGGSTGGVRFVAHRFENLRAVAEAFSETLPDAGSSLVTLPPFHVSGLMPVFRSWAAGGRLRFADVRAINSGRPVAEDPDGLCLSLVPTQLARLVPNPDAVAWLRRFHVILLGGAATPAPLVAACRAARLPIAPCYGMTETAAFACLLPPVEFLSGVDGVGRPLARCKLRIDAAKLGEPGIVCLSSPGLCHGYWPDVRAGQFTEWRTSDLGIVPADGSLRLLGRADRLINSGGEKTNPADVEAAAWATGLVRDVHAYGEPDPEWGAIVCLDWVPAGDDVDEARLAAALRERLAPWQRPRRYRRLAEIPRSAAGKIQRK